MSIQQLDVKSLRLTTPILNAIKSLNPAADVSGFTMESGPQGFRLPRIEENAAATGTPPPITVRKKDNGYEIIDGRHRAAIAIARGKTTIDAIVQGGGRKTRSRKPRGRRIRKATRRR